MVFWLFFILKRENRISCYKLPTNQIDLWYKCKKWPDVSTHVFFKCLMPTNTHKEVFWCNKSSGKKWEERARERDREREKAHRQSKRSTMNKETKGGRYREGRGWFDYSRLDTQRWQHHWMRQTKEGISVDKERLFRPWGWMVTFVFWIFSYHIPTLLCLGHLRKWC